jgi:hypothetical protein
VAVGDIKAGRAYVEIGTDNANLDKGLARAQTAVMGFGSKIGSAVNSMGAFVAGIAAAIAAVKFLSDGISGAVRRASEFVDIADRLGADVVGLQGLAFASGRLGVELESVNGAMQKLQKGLGSGAVSGELKKIGLATEDLIGLEADEAFLRVVDALRSVSDQNEQAALTAKLFGKGGQELQGIIKEGSESLRQMASEGKALGVIMGEDLARGFEQAGDAAEDASKAVESLFNQKFFQERVGAYSDLISELVTLGEAKTDFFNGMELKIERQNANARQYEVDQANAVKFAEAQAVAADETDAFLESMEEEILAFDDLSSSMDEYVDRLKAAKKLEEDRTKRAQQIFDSTRTPEEEFATGQAEARDLLMSGKIDLDTYGRRFGQLLATMPKKLQEASASSSAAGTFNPFGVRGLGDNDELTKAAKETAKNTKKLADNAQPLVFK